MSDIHAEFEESDAASAGMEPAPTGAGRKRGGGPRTADGKRISSQNARRHGILSPDPVAGDESLDDWTAFHEAVRADLGPVGAYEDECVYNIAMTLWSLRRVTRQITDLINLNELLLECPETGPVVRRIRRGNVTWQEYSRPFEAGTSLEILGAMPDDYELDADIVDDCVRSIQTTGSAFVMPGAPESATTAGYLRSVIEAAASERGVPGETVVTRAVLRLEMVDGLARGADERARDEQLAEVAKAARAARRHLPDHEEYDKLLRYQRSLEKSLEGWLKRLEDAQRARCGELPPRVRIDVRAA